MYKHTEYNNEDIRLMEKIATTKLDIPDKNKSAFKPRNDTTIQRTVNNTQIISSKNRTSAPTPIQTAPIKVDPARDKIVKACANIPIFNGINPKDLFSFMLQPKVETFKDGDEILKANSSTKRIYIPIAGEICIIDESHGMYSLNGFIESFGIFNLAETVTYRKNKYTYIASGSGAIEVISFAINEGMQNSSPNLFATIYKNISKVLSNDSLDK